MPSLAVSTGAAQQQVKMQDCEVNTGLTKGRAMWSLAPGAGRPGGVWSDNAETKIKSQARSRSGTPRPPVLSPGSWLARTGRDGKGDGANKHEEGYATPTYISPRGDLGTTSRTPPQSFSFAPWGAVPPMDLNDYTGTKSDDLIDLPPGLTELIAQPPHAVKMHMKAQTAPQEDADAVSDVLLPAPIASKAGGAVSEAATSAPSAGSVGHPYTCASACRYVKRKGGCRDGANCPNCHLCFWKRADGNLTKDATVTKASVADGMPSDLGQLICPPCAEDTSGVPPPPAPFNSTTLQALTGAFDKQCTVAPPPGLSLDGESEASTTDLNLVVSFGSVGHPHKCALPCKYFGKSRGCKDGKNCMRCHICVWRHTDAKRTFDEDRSDDEEDVTPVPPRFSEASANDASSEADFPLPAPSMVAVDLKETQAKCYPAEPERLPLEVPMKIVTEPPNENWSLGSIGHPFACAQACKYRYRKGGCRDGRQCLCCHQCRWSRHAPAKTIPEDFSDYYPGLEFLKAEQTVAPLGGATVGQ